MSFGKIAILVLAISLLMFAGLSHAGGAVRVAAHARRAQNGHIMVKFTITNCGPDKIAINYGDLPWHQRFTTLIAYLGSGDFATMLPTILPFADYPPHVVYVAPYTSKHGETDLSFYVPALKKIKNLSNLIIFWSYELTDLKFKHLKTFGGMITLRDPITYHGCEDLERAK